MDAKQIIAAKKHKKLASAIQEELAEACVEITGNEKVFIDVKYTDGKFVASGPNTYHVRHKLKLRGFQWNDRAGHWEMDLYGT
jgi:hypothetical protein